MELDLGAPNLIAEIIPDGEDGINGGLSRDMKEFDIRKDRHVANDSFHNVIEETNRWGRLMQFAGGQVATPCEPYDGAKIGNSKRICSRKINGGEGELNCHDPEWI